MKAGELKILDKNRGFVKERKEKKGDLKYWFIISLLILVFLLLFPHACEVEVNIAKHNECIELYGEDFCN